MRSNDIFKISYLTDKRMEELKNELRKYNIEGTINVPWVDEFDCEVFRIYDRYTELLLALYNKGVKIVINIIYIPTNAVTNTLYDFKNKLITSARVNTLEKLMDLEITTYLDEYLEFDSTLTSSDRKVLEEFGNMYKKITAICTPH